MSFSLITFFIIETPSLSSVFVLMGLMLRLSSYLGVVHLLISFAIATISILSYLCLFCIISTYLPI